MTRIKNRLAVAKNKLNDFRKPKHKIVFIPVPESSPIINTPWRPRTTVWRLKSKAAAAEKALHAAILNKIKPFSSKTSTTQASHVNSLLATPTKGQHEILISTPYTTRGMAGSISSDSGGSMVADESGMVEGDDDNGSDFEDIEEGIDGNEKLQPEIEPENVIAEARELWPEYNTVSIQYNLLYTGIQDMKSLLASKNCPTGHDFTWHLQVLQFMNWQVRGIKNPHLQSLPSRRECAMNVAIGYGKGAKVRERILKNEKLWIQSRKIPTSKQGKVSKMHSMLQDEGTIMVVQECISGASGGIRAEIICKAVSEYWQSQMPNINRQQELQLLSESLDELELKEETAISGQHKLTIHASTARRWLHKLGYSWKEVRKGVYKDGHERPDVVDYRQNVFLKTIEDLKPRMPAPLRDSNGEVEGVDLPTLPPGTKFCIPVTHDECTCNANDGPHYQWIKGDENPLRKKSRGQGLHISEFLTPYGRLSIPEYEMSDHELLSHGFHKRDATEIIQCGGDIWWDQDHIVQQTSNAISIFEAAYPGCQALFLFDNATSHSAYSEDALRASRMNKGPGGEQPHMRDGYWVNADGNKVIQKMNYAIDDQNVLPELRGKPKGIQVILEERGIWPQDGLYLDCSTRKHHQEIK